MKIQSISISDYRYNHRLDAKENFCQGTNTMSLPSFADSKCSANISFHGKMVFFNAASLGNLATLEREIANGVDINARDADGYTALIHACRHNKKEVVKELLKQPNINVNIQNNNFTTALIYACNKGCPEIVEELLKHPDVDVNLTDSNDFTALDWAEKNGDIIIANMIRSYKRGVDRRELGPTTPRSEANVENFLNAAFEGDLETLRQEIANEVDINARDADGYTALIHACQNNKKEIVKELLKQPNIDVNAQNNNKETALIWASYRGDKYMVEELLKHPDIDVHLCDCSRKTARSWAMVHDDFVIIDMIMNYQRGVDKREGVVQEKPKLNKEKSAPKEEKKIINPFDDIKRFECTILSSDKRIKDMALNDLIEYVNSDKFDPSRRDSLGRDVMQLALLSKNEKAKKIIASAITKGADINTQNSGGVTLLMQAIKSLISAKNDDEKTILLSNIKFILNQNPDMDIQDSIGNTAFHYACMSTSSGLMEMIMDKCPNILLKNKNGNIGGQLIKEQKLADIYNRRLFIKL